MGANTPSVSPCTMHSFTLLAVATITPLTGAFFIRPTPSFTTTALPAVGIFFGTSTGNTEDVAIAIQEAYPEAEGPFSIDEFEGELEQKFKKYVLERSDAKIVETNERASVDSTHVARRRPTGPASASNICTNKPQTFHIHFISCHVIRSARARAFGGSARHNASREFPRRAVHLHTLTLLPSHLLTLASLRSQV